MRASGALIGIALLTSLLSAAGAASATGETDGVDVMPALDGTSVVSITSTSPSSDGVPWIIVVELDQTAADNGSIVRFRDQICINSGLCFSPVVHEMNASNGNRTWTGEVLPPEDHTYVRWQVEVEHADGSEAAELAWGKTWSDCWKDLESGRYTPSGCRPDDAMADNAEGESLPAAGGLSIVGVLALAAVALKDRSGSHRQPTPLATLGVPLNATASSAQDGGESTPPTNDQD